MQGILDPEALIDGSEAGRNAAHIIPSMATLFEIMISANGHNPLYPSLDPNLDPKLGQTGGLRENVGKNVVFPTT